MKVTVNSFCGGLIVDVYLLNSEDEIITFQQGIDQDVAESFILSMIHSYNLSSDTPITLNFFNDDESLKKSYKKTVSEFLIL